MNWVWANIEFLWGLLVIPLLALLTLFIKSRPAAPFPAMNWLKHWGKGRAVRRPGRDPFLLMRFLAITAIILALARPQHLEESRFIENPGRDIMLVIDVSGSMMAHDFFWEGERVDRLVIVQNIISQFVEKRPNDRIGIIAFAREPYLVSPLTLDHSWLQRNIDRMHIGIIDPNGTAIGTSLAASLNRLLDSPEDSRLVILLTDGENNAGSISPLAAGQLAADLGIRVHTIGVGIDGMVPFPQMRGNRIIRDRQGNPIFQQAQFAMDNETMQKIADMTGGRFFLAERTEELIEIYQTIDALEATEVELSILADVTEMAHWFIIIALALILLEALGRHLISPRYP